MDVVGEIRRVPETKLILFLSVRGTVNFSRMGSTFLILFCSSEKKILEIRSTLRRNQGAARVGSSLPEKF